jgi:putative ABC transport system permease protein
MARTPLAWQNLTHNKRRFALSLAGVGFAVVLMFIELGFYHALLDSTVALIDRFDADLVMVSKLKTSMQILGGFPRRRLVQALSVPGVAAVRPLYLDVVRSRWRSDRAERRQSLRALGLDPDAPALRFPEVREFAGRLRLPNQVLFDKASRTRHARDGDRAADDLAGRDVYTAGEFHLGLDFVTEGNLILGESAFAHYFPVRHGSALRQVEVGMIELAPGADQERVRAELNARLPTWDGASADGGSDVTVLTKDEFRDRDLTFWRKSTPIGFIFGMGAVMGLIVGVVICYQVLATDVADHLREFATLKAMGYGGGYLAGVVLQEALWLALVGFVPGCLASWGLYWLLERATGLPLLLTVPRAGFVLGLTVLMCSLSGLLALRRVVTADPAELF